jgi:DNA (cytosine-5)-methyltransferase 1
VNVLSLFSGVGGIDLGFERAGMRVVGQCEADRQARMVLQRHWPDVPCHPDVTELNAEWLESNGIQLADRNGSGSGLHGGVSVASQGTNPGGDDVGFPERCGNGTGADNGCEHGHGNGTGRGDFRVDVVCGGFPCQDLSVAGKRKGFDGERSVLFYEAARVADLVLSDGGWLIIENVPGLFSSNSGRDFGAVLASLAELGFYDCAWRVLDSRYFGVPQRRRRVFIVARRSRGDGAKQVLLEPEGGGGDFAPRKQTGKGVAGTVGPRLANALDRQSGGPDDNSAQANHLVEGGGVRAFTQNTRDEVRYLGPGGEGDHAGALASQPGMKQTTYLQGDTGVRRLTPTECERLQGFPDGWTIPDETDWREYPKPDGPRYAQMGNAVTVPVAEWLGNRIMDWEQS